MKKILSLIVVLTMIATLFVGIQVNAASGTYTITATGPATVDSAVATSFDVTISIDGLSATAPMGPTAIKMTYDNTKFSVVTGTNNSTGGSGKPKFTAGKVVTDARTDLGATIAIATGIVTSGTTSKVAVVLNTDTPIQVGGVVGTFTFVPLAQTTESTPKFDIIVSDTDTNSNDGSIPPAMHTFVDVDHTLTLTAPVLENQDAPTGLVADSSTATLKITGTTAAMEYKLSTDTTYTACTDTATVVPAAGTYNVRYAAKTGFNASPDANVVVSAYIAPQDAPTGLSQDNSTLTLKITGTTTAMEYKLLTDTTYTACTDTATVVAAGTYNVRFAAKTGYNASPDATVEVLAYVPLAQDAPTGLSMDNSTLTLKITGTTTAMEYKLSTDTTYTACTDTATVVLAGTYNVRYAATQLKAASPDATVEVLAYVPPLPQDAPTGLVADSSTATLKITGTTTAMEYKLSTDTTYTACTEAETVVPTAGTYNVRYASKSGFYASSDVNVIVSAYVAPQDAPIGLSMDNSTLTLKITGTTTAMEYKLSTASTYTACTATETVVPVAGTYNVRYAAKTGYYASPDATVVVLPVAVVLSTEAKTLRADQKGVSIPVTISNFLNLTGSSFVINYDSTKIENVVFTPDSSFTGQSTADTGTLSVAFAGSNVISLSPKVLGTITFDVKAGVAEGDVAFSITDAKYAPNAADVPVDAVNVGKLTVSNSIIGDVDNNGQVQTYDATLVLKYIVDSVANPLSADALLRANIYTTDEAAGTINVNDALKILLKVLNKVQ